MAKVRRKKKEGRQRRKWEEGGLRVRWTRPLPRLAAKRLDCLSGLYAIVLLHELPYCCMVQLLKSEEDCMQVTMAHCRDFKVVLYLSV